MHDLSVLSMPLYNDARFIYHALGPDFKSPELGGIDPPKSVELMRALLTEFCMKNSSLSPAMVSRIERIQKVLLEAKTQYKRCVRLTLEPNEADANAMAIQVAHEIAQDVGNLVNAPSHSSILLIGGHYIREKRGLNGHTATYEVVRQENGKLCFIINNTGVGIQKYHQTTAERTYQLTYRDLDVQDLNFDFWRQLIQTSFMNPVTYDKLMDSFYAFVDKALHHNKLSGRCSKRQKPNGNVCAWKSLSTWLHNQIAPGNFKMDRNPADERVYLEIKKFMFEQMLTTFNPNKPFHPTLRVARGYVFKVIRFSIRFFNNNCGYFFKIPDDFCYRTIAGEPAVAFLKAELQRKIEKLDNKIRAG